MDDAIDYTIDYTIDNKHQLYELMHLGATVVTPNNRLSNQLIRDYYNHQQSHVLDKPVCLPYPAFLRHQFQTLCHLYPKTNHPVILSPVQQSHLWQQLIENQQAYPCNEGLLLEIQEAWKRCQTFQVDMDDHAFFDTPQTLQFQQWQKELQQQLIQINAITEEQIVPELLRHEEKMPVPTLLIWVCFDDYTPQQRALQQEYDKRGCTQHHYDHQSNHNHSYQYAADDKQHEYVHIRHWLKTRLDKGESRIGVVVPDLQTESAKLQRFLEHTLPTSDFNISLGKSLTEYPLITHALACLNLNKTRISRHEAHLLLHSPYIAHAKSEFLDRTQLMQNSPVLQETDICVAHLIKEWQTKVPQFTQLICQLNEYPEKAPPKVWVQQFKERLMQMGFPGEYPINSSTYQLFQRFVDVFDELLQLSIIYNDMTAQTAFAALYDICKSTVFQIKQNTPIIQVMGLLEASGCTFDSIWVCGLTDQCLPKKTKLSAFIPLELQRTLKMPHALPARELRLAEQTLKRLQAGCSHIVLSYPKMTADIPNMPSPLIHHHKVFNAPILDNTERTTALITFQEDYLIPLQEKEHISGGTSLLSNQAICPFRAFATHRLHAKPALLPSTGPDMSERGKTLHRIMELLWRQLKSQHHLNTLAQETLSQYIQEAIQQSLAPLIHSRPFSFSHLVQDVERTRLTRLVNACLDWEKQRPSFVISAVEESAYIQLAGIDFQVRIDRLDELESSQKWVIDYKTSIPVNKPWQETRPEAPQLLLYALLYEDINALLFIQLKAGRISISGVSEEKLAIKGINTIANDTPWQTHRMQWHQQLTDLAYEIRAGFCPPTPNRASNCQFCNMDKICRKNFIHLV